MRILKALFFAVGLVFLVRPAHAGLLLEPYLGYSISSTELILGSGSGTGADGVTLKFDNTGTVLGGRVGMTIPMFFFAIDASALTGTAKYKSSSDSTYTSVDQTLNGTTLALVGGVNLLIFRAYAGYGFLTETKFSASGTDATYKGTTMKVGASFTGLPLVALNLEYFQDSYSKVKLSSGDFDLKSSGIYKDFKTSGILFSVSLPLSL